jgi:hypothetical protein
MLDSRPMTVEPADHPRFASLIIARWLQNASEVHQDRRHCDQLASSMTAAQLIQETMTNGHIIGYCQVVGLLNRARRLGPRQFSREVFQGRQKRWFGVDTCNQICHNSDNGGMKIVH